MGIFERKLGIVGQGVSGKVELHQSRQQGLIAVKHYHNKQPHETEEDYKFRVTNEYNQLKKLSHLHIITVFKHSKALFYNHYYLYMELGSTKNLKQMVSQKIVSSIDELLCLFKQLVSGMTYLHHQQTWHRDLKPDNLIIGEDGFLKIIDFVDSRTGPDMAVGLVGTEPYIAPEVFTHLKYAGDKCDIWSMGIILYYFSTTKLPWKLAKPENPEFQQFKDNAHLLLTSNEECDQFLMNCLSIDPNERWTIDEMGGNAWFSRISWCDQSRKCSYDHKRLYCL